MAPAPTPPRTHQPRLSHTPTPASGSYVIPRTARQLWQPFLPDRTRLLRFAAVGGLCGLVQLALLFMLKRSGVHAVTANIIAFLLSAQFTFYFSSTFTWHDRRCSLYDWGKRWLTFQGSIAGTFVLSQLIFIGSRAALPDLVASATGIGVAAVVNFAIQDRLTFRMSAHLSADA